MEDANQKKKMILYGIVATIAVFVVVLVLLVVLMAQESSKTKIIFDGNRTPYNQRNEPVGFWPIVQNPV